MPADPETIAALAALTAQVTLLTAAQADPVADPRIAELEAALAAAQVPDPQVAILAAQVADLEAAALAMKPNLPVGGLSASAITDAQTLIAKSVAGAFKTKPRS